MSPLRALRRARQLTLEQVSADSGVDVGALSRIERGKQFSKSHAPKLVAYFGKEAISLDDILYYDPNKDSEASHA